MKTKPTHFRRYWTLYALGGGAIAVLATARLFVPPAKFDWPAWVQAVGSIAAVIASGLIATIQADRQFYDSHRLQKLERARQALRLAVAVTTVTEKAVVQVMFVIRWFNWERENIHLIGSGEKSFDRSLLEQIKNDLLSVPMHELPSGSLMYSLMSMHSITRLLKENVEKALNGHRRMDATAFESFFAMLDNAHMQMCLHFTDMDRITRLIHADCEI